jgi:hypothetical protein
MTSPASPYIAPEASDKKWWDPFGLFASKPAPSNPPSDFTPSATAGRRRTRRAKKGGLTPLEDAGRLTDAEIRDLTQGRKVAFSPTQIRKRKGGRRTRRGKKHSRK